MINIIGMISRIGMVRLSLRMVKTIKVIPVAAINHPPRICVFFQTISETAVHGVTIPIDQF